MSEEEKKDVAGLAAPLHRIEPPASRDEMHSSEIPEARFVTLEQKEIVREPGPPITPTVSVPYSRRLLDMAPGEKAAWPVGIKRFAPREDYDAGYFCGMCGMEYLLAAPTVADADEHLRECPKYPARELLEQSQRDVRILAREADAFYEVGRLAWLVASYGMVYEPGRLSAGQERDILKREGERLGRIDPLMLQRVKVLLWQMIPHTCTGGRKHPKFDWCAPCVIWDEIEEGGFAAYQKRCS